MRIPKPKRRSNPQETEEERREELRPSERTEELTGEGDGREEFDWDNYLEDYGPMGVTYDRKEGTAPSWDNLLVAKSSLTDHLMWQLLLSQVTDDERRIGEQIIGNLDQNGYLVATLEEIAVQEKVDPAFVEEVLKKVQEFDPLGIAARDLQECLLIQARMLGSARPLVERIIIGHLKDLEIKNYTHIARKLKVSHRRCSGGRRHHQPHGSPAGKRLQRGTHPGDRSRCLCHQERRRLQDRPQR